MLRAMWEKWVDVEWSIWVTSIEIDLELSKVRSKYVEAMFAFNVGD
jgi:hypothetical protein